MIALPGGQDRKDREDCAQNEADSYAMKPSLVIAAPKNEAKQCTPTDNERNDPPGTGGERVARQDEQSLQTPADPTLHLRSCAHRFDSFGRSL